MTTDSQQDVAVLGAGGTMGFPMVRNIARAGIPVRAWNRSEEKAEPLSDDGVEVVSSAADAVDGAAVIVTILSDADAVLDLMEGALSGARDDAVWLQMSTIGEAGTERCIELAEQRGVGFVDAPVLGTKQPAEQGDLVVLASGAEELRPRVDPVLDAVGKKTMWVGEAGSGTRLKLVTNAWILSVVEGGAESIALAEGLGVEPSLLFEAIEGGPLDLPYLRMKGEAMAKRSFEPSFSLRLAAKDAGLVEEAARRRGLDLPLVEVIHDRLEQGVDDHGDEDVSATFWTSAPDRAPA